MNMHSKFSNVKNWSPLKIVGMVVGGIALATFLAFLFGYVVMLLWNWLMPEIFGLIEINFWQAVGIVVLAKLLFGIGGGGDHKSDKKCKSHPSKGSWHSERNEDFSKWNYYDRFWKEKGRQDFEDFVREEEAREAENQEKL